MHSRANKSQQLNLLNYQRNVAPGKWCPVKQKTSQNVWPRINSPIKTAVSKNHAQRRQFFDNVTLVARRREHFRGVLADFFCCWTPSKKGCVNTQEFTRFLSTGVVSASSHALWRVLSNKVIRVFGHCWVDIPHMHTSEWDSLFF